MVLLDGWKIEKCLDEFFGCLRSSIYFAQLDFSSKRAMLKRGDPPASGPWFTAAYHPELPIKLEPAGVSEWHPLASDVTGGQVEGVAHLVVLSTEGKYEKEWPLTVYGDALNPKSSAQKR